MTLRAAVLGHPISHSKSPALHLAAYRQLDADISYTAIDVTEQLLPGLMGQVRRQPGWCGLSVTMPLKTAMLGHVDEVRGIARTLGVVNTVSFEDDGHGPRAIGSNTDVAGIVNALRHAGANAAPSAVILGGGGTAASAVAALQELGTRRVQIFARDPARTADVRAAAASAGVGVDVLTLAEAVLPTAAADVVISTLPPRAADGLAGELAALKTETPGVLLDVAYDPWPSLIASVWRAGGGAVVPGLEMLLYQAVEQVRLFTGRGDDVNAAVIDVMCASVGLPRRAL
ncbi:Shikimate dehydrogenase substrate binding domain protein [Pseudarthrobacter chlorophenolicus A6]|uniref:Shikimate dehydrogenase substrate binding domain protein n=1 Tax=Pseudarthrobacter chlorophenolicus (strain ATCC 700700 / DSM 12829 / CIP 107037 / JCM 12360 / KCTC 9906 / NCIMB 13794 / A6) TaxID=452863 RepID=B8H8V8_PSECP|nr:shikimate dehydrogenase [Pseudarthrobacter chlorophenolicus]ACL39986.1 Shikimate dehydrogenase substrate binding domain protein [Pseudarthrobacter chlorophenolicus A6]SDQ90081.1 shikimate dehydrogenase [Pseudarthrobacter chlorophenolicus]